MTKVMANIPREPLAVTLTAIDSIDALAGLWCDLERRVSPSFFLSWTWIGTWLESTGVKAGLLTARAGDRVVGLALVASAKPRSHGLRIPALCLHQSGSPAQDCITIEYNGFLAEPAWQAEVTTAFLEHLLSIGRDSPWHWYELRLGGIDPALGERAVALGAKTRLRVAHGCPYADLDAEAGVDYLDQLSRNSRHQIRRAMRLYENFGALGLERADCLADAQAWFDEMKRLCTAYWNGKGQPGAFGEPFFEQFHRRLIATAFPLGQIDLMRVTAGSRLLGYLYNFRHNGIAYSYQSGFNYGPDGRFKPGMVSHVLAIRHYTGEGLRQYRFLAGESQYKRSLSTSRHDLVWLGVYRDTLVFRLESLARRAKAGLTSIIS